MAQPPKDQPWTYQITTRGRLDAGWGNWFANCRFSFEKEKNFEATKTYLSMIKQIKVEELQNL